MRKSNSKTCKKTHIGLVIAVLKVDRVLPEVDADANGDEDEDEILIPDDRDLGLEAVLANVDERKGIYVSRVSGSLSTAPVTLTCRWRVKEVSSDGSVHNWLAGD